jgi:hypothetical protein
MAGDRKNVFELGGRACPTDAGTRAGGLRGVVDVLEEVLRCD